jgi:membrane protein DedA with SNARE-associated domain
MSELLAQLTTWINEVILGFGYIGLGFLLLLETLFPPIPSELILPFAGSLAQQGKMEFYLVILATTLGSVAGAVLFYYIGLWAGEKKLENWLAKYGKWLALAPEDLHRSRRWFARYGDWAVLIARLIPGVRSIISLPAGVCSMPFGRFMVFTVIGSTLWNILLAGAGYLLAENWKQIEDFVSGLSKPVYFIVGAAVVGFIGYRVWKRVRNATKNDATPSPADAE